MSNKTASGTEFDHSTLSAVWSKAAPVQGYDPNKYRKDRCGAWIAWEEYGQTKQFGWEVDHIYPQSLGGNDRLDNLQPLHWSYNRAKGDNVGLWTPAVRGWS